MKYIVSYFNHKIIKHLSINTSIVIQPTIKNIIIIIFVAFYDYIKRDRFGENLCKKFYQNTQFFEKFLFI